MDIDKGGIMDISKGRIMNISKERRVVMFRAWDRMSKMMIYGLNIPNIRTSNVLDDINMFTFMQYIGRRDKDGLNIYEEDIVIWTYPSDDYHNSDNIYGVVRWDNDSCGFKIKQLTNGFYEYGCGSRGELKFYDDYGRKRNFEFEDLQVVGNAYENADFVKANEVSK